MARTSYRAKPDPGRAATQRLRTEAGFQCHGSGPAKRRRGVDWGYRSVSNPERSGISKSGSGTSEWRRSEEHTSELQSRLHLVCRLLLEKKKIHTHVYSLHDRRRE